MEAFICDTIRTPFGRCGGAITIGRASDARLIITTALNQLERSKGSYALYAMCIGVGLGIALIFKRV